MNGDWFILCGAVLFVLMLKRPSRQFFSHVETEPTLPGFNQYCRELMCLAQGHNTVPPFGIEPRTSRFGVRRSTTTPSRPLFFGAMSGK